MMQKARSNLGPVFYISITILALFVLWGAIFTDHLAHVTQELLGWVLDTFSWLYVSATFGFLIFVVYLALSRYGTIRLGKDTDRPEYRYTTWLAMLFSAGMGIGLVFWGVAEPMYHFVEPPFGRGEGATPEAARQAMRYAFFHWGLHAWGIYALTAMALAYFRFRKGQPGLISSVFYPLLKERVNGPIGYTIDIIAIFATAFGVATSLGLGTLQINGGLNAVFDVPINTTTQMLIIAVVTVLFVTSAATGLNRGILYLSNVNMILAFILMMFLFIMGPTIFILKTFTQTAGSYMDHFLEMSFSVSAFEGHPWIESWTLFYWAWWIAWAPFVGSFIARVSKGRTIREFVSGVLIVPTLFGFLWFATFGGAAIDIDMMGGGNIGEAVLEDETRALFVTLEHFPLGTVMSLIAILLISTFFVTSADSATFVLGMMSTRGSMNPDFRIKFMWGLIQSGIAAVLLLAGGLLALQRASILAALPFAIIMIGMVVALRKALAEELEQP